MACRARLLGLIAGLCLLLAPNHDAAARKFQMSGTWFERRGQLFFPPLQFAGSPDGASTHVSMGDLTSAFGTPHGAILGEGGVTATGSAPATLRIPRHRFVEDAMALVPFEGGALVQITTNVGIDAP